MTNGTLSADDSVAVVVRVARADDAVHCAARLTLTAE